MSFMGVNFTLDKYCQILLLGGVSWIVGGILGLTGLCCGWLTFFTFWIASTLIYIFLATQKVSQEGKAVLVTGCDSGFGHALALHLDSLGFRVFAACLFADKNGDGALSLRKQGSDKLHVIQMNVVSESEIASARKEVEKLLPKDECLWGIINNAGMGTFGDLEWVSIATYKRIADVNIFGMIAVTKAFLPLVRKAKGRIVNVASMLGRMGAPMRSPYVLTKWAVEGMSECLRLEMKPWDVSVVVIEPGNFIAGTNIFTEESVQKSADDMWKTMPDDVKEDYGEEFYQSRVKLMKSYIHGGVCDVSPVIDTFEEALLQKYPQTRYQPMDWYYKTRVFMATHLPEWIYDKIYVGCLYK